MTTLSEISKIHPRPEYIFTSDFDEARFAVNHLPDSRALNFCNPVWAETIYDTFMSQLPELENLYESFIDDESRRTFCGYWHANISRQINELVYANTSHYMMAGFIPEPGAIFIDCGACDGYTSAKFMNLGCKVYAFEMDRINFEMAKKLADEKGFVVENLGLGSYAHEMRYTHNDENIGASVLNANGSEITQIVKLDTYVSENKIPRVDFIKMDVEGAELDILKGAADTIARFKPILALSAYHKWDDLTTLTNFVKSIRPDYEFALRQYYETIEDVPFSFKNGRAEKLVALGLEAKLAWYNELVLLAR